MELVEALIYEDILSPSQRNELSNIILSGMSCFKPVIPGEEETEEEEAQEEEEDFSDLEQLQQTFGYIATEDLYSTTSFHAISRPRLQKVSRDLHTFLEEL